MLANNKTVNQACKQQKIQPTSQTKTTEKKLIENRAGDQALRQQDRQSSF
jgi:hypothetical protein